MTAMLSRPSSTVFIVDDDTSFLKSMLRLLRAVGYTVETFGSAQEFLDRLTPEMSGCVVTDLQMPEMNGLELQEALMKLLRGLRSLGSLLLLSSALLAGCNRRPSTDNPSADRT